MSIKICFSIFCLLAVAAGRRTNYEVRRFPEGFKFGAATASYQVEGAWNAADKGENIWDRLAHTTSLVADGSSGDFACDSYNQHRRDVEMLKELGVDYYRFSLSWSRLLPSGLADRISEDGLRYYNALINDLIAANITPSVTLYHWDLPQPLQDMGGWENPMIAKYFSDYANVAFEAFGDRVKTWLTFNEPWIICELGYGGNFAPSLGMSGTADYVCAHNLLKAHAQAYHLYSDVFRPSQGGRIGLTLNSDWNEPETSSEVDIEAANRNLQFNLGWFAHPIFSREGDYPQVMKQRIADKSAEQGLPQSRLPEFTQEEINYIRGSSDFFGLNHYTTVIAKMPTYELGTRANFWEDLGTITYQDGSWPGSASGWLKVVPWGFTKLLNWISTEYNGVEIIVMENGFSDNRDNFDDDDRVSYYNQYLNALLDAIENGANVSAYTAWSLMDNFEWLSGYTERFGMYHVNFNDPSRTRTPKKSALYYKEITGSRTIERNFIAKK